MRKIEREKEGKRGRKRKKEIGMQKISGEMKGVA